MSLGSHVGIHRARTDAIDANAVGRQRQRQALREADDTELRGRIGDQVWRFLTVGDIDGDGNKEMVAATSRRGLWLLRPGAGEWDKELIDANSSGFEHASILLDLDGDGRDELYVASDNQDQVRRYVFDGSAWQSEVILEYTDELGRFTWNIMPAPAGLLLGGR